MDSPVALVTGGGSGIGLAVAEHLIQHHGFKVAILDRDAGRVRDQSNRLGSNRCFGIHADVSSYEQQLNAFIQTFEWGGNRLDLFFANAGIGGEDSLYKDLSIDETTGLPKPLNLSVVDINLSAVLQGVHLARHFFEKGGGMKVKRIVATSSVLGMYPHHALALYSTTKHGIVGLVRSCAPVYLKDCITINAILPTLVETNLMPAHVQPRFHGENPHQLTPMSTAFKAFDAILADDELTGQVMELTLEEVVFKQQPGYSRENIKWMFAQHELWETAAEKHMPRRPGENAAVVKTPKQASI